jgi:putative ABC transport system permease protein
VMADRLAGSERLIRVEASYNDKTGQYGVLRIEDVDSLRALDHVNGVNPIIQEGNVDSRGIVGRARVSISSVDFFYQELNDVEMLKGKFFTKEETAVRTRACIISDKVAQSAFGYEDPIGQQLRLKGTALVVAGVFRFEERRRVRGEASVLIPYQTAYYMFGKPQIYQIDVHANPDETDAAKAEILVWKARRAKPNDVDIKDSRDEEKRIAEWARACLIQMGTVASISLFVGGIGLMNVMLTTVAERTHEIGVRKALGADSRAILGQFLIESATLSTVGGLSGAFLGVFFSYGLEVMTKGDMHVSIVPVSLFAAVGFSVVTGIFFGLYPASVAARLSPVEALRYQ